jgi:2-(1,2-epoxy-1,2-dihydrophenyl)acetyl-CoA isomerase
MPSIDHWRQDVTDFKSILFNVEAGIAHITLNRPDAGNALNFELASELAQAALACDNDPAVKVVLISANGRMFCAGGDLKAFVGFEDQTGLRVKELADAMHKAVSLFARMSPPVVIAVNGPSAGAGFSLALIGDYVIAGESAKFTMAYTAAGLSPDGSSTYYLPRLVGLRKAQELALTNRTLAASEALEWGLVTRVVADAALRDEALAVSRRIASGPAFAQSVVKKLLLCSLRNGLEEQMELEGREISRAAQSPDGKEGIRAFTEKRKPVFR